MTPNETIKATAYTSEEWEKKFDKKVNELRRLKPEVETDSESVDFGFKTNQAGVLYTIVDFGNIKSFIRAHFIPKSSHEAQIKAIIEMTDHSGCVSREEVREMIEKIKKEVHQRPLIQKGGEFERRNDLKYQEKCMVYMAQSSYNRALTDLLKALETK